MIKFFRKIRKKLIEQSKVRNYFFYAIGEILLVVIGILIALQINTWNESQKEANTAKILAQSMISDLENDMAALHFVIDFNTEKREVIEYFISIIKLPQETWDLSEFYRGMSTTFTTFPFSPTDGTYTQMKSSGTLQYFNQSLVNIMNAYDNQLRKTLFRDELIEKAEWELVPLASTIVNFEVTGELRFNNPITQNMYIKRIDDPATRDHFINKVMTVKIMMGRSLEEYLKQLLLAEELMKNLKHEYQIN
ncbi:DUF6090 family protein [Planktosalinus lacus]|uniref:Uncharacterized protein n=1 Tax=Planktosalinus lacus TaxID=1526573 RepID=A0A8J2Y9Z0_9FLAO|nr:DUF6090 family protein [Planktosalinus lacus]GGE02019.1 hypothetical protein GCM10011312_26730 [Planktosalinus lacus]